MSIENENGNNATDNELGENVAADDLATANAELERMREELKAAHVQINSLIAKRDELLTEAKAAKTKARDLETEFSAFKESNGDAATELRNLRLNLPVRAAIDEIAMDGATDSVLALIEKMGYQFNLDANGLPIILDANGKPPIILIGGTKDARGKWVREPEAVEAKVTADHIKRLILEEHKPKAERSSYANSLLSLIRASPATGGGASGGAGVAPNKPEDETKAKPPIQFGMN